MRQHNGFIDVRYLENKNNELLDLLKNRCWWLESWCHKHLESCVQSDFLYERIERVKNEEEKT